MHIMVIAGEPSGDLHAAEVVATLQKKQPNIRFTGIGGAHLAQQHVSLIHTLDAITCFGFSQALRHYRRLRQILNNIVAGWQHDRPDLLLLVDFGGFNLKLAKHAKKHGIRVFYFIPPKVWAWGRHRTKTMANTITQAAAILPFEAEYLERHGIPCCYVGNPSVHQVTQFKRQYQRPPHQATYAIGILPGSRRSEIMALLPIFLETLTQPVFKQQRLKVYVSRAEAAAAWFEEMLAPYNMLDMEVRTDGLSVMHDSDAILIASGTATLEAALLATPMVIAYKTSALTYWLWRFFRQQPWIGLPNILLQKTQFPECIQHNANPQNLAKQLQNILTQKDHPQAFKAIAQQLATPGSCAENTATQILSLLYPSDTKAHAPCRTMTST